MRTLRASGLIAIVACLVMVVSDLLTMTTLDLARPRPLWEALNEMSDRQMLWGYYLGVLMVPVYAMSWGWHVALAARPAGRWASWLVFLASAYAACLAAVWHASFGFYRSFLRLGAADAAEYVLSHYAWGPFVLSLVVVGAAWVVMTVLIVTGRTLYPAWAAVVSPLVTMPTMFVVAPRTSGALSVVLMAAGWNVAGLVSLAASAAILWNRAGVGRTR